MGLAAAQRGAGQVAKVTAYSSALDGFESKVNMASFDPVAWTKERYRQMPMKLTRCESLPPKP